MSNTTLWDVIARDLAEQITSGELKAGNQLQSEAELAKRYGVSRMTLRQALDRLQRDGLVVRRHGTGTFVADSRQVHRSGNRLGPFHEEIGLSEEQVETRVTEVEVHIPPAEIVRALDLGRSQTAIRFQRLRLLDNAAICLQETWVPVLLDPRLARESLIKGSIYETLKIRLGIEIVRASVEVSASNATEVHAKMLDVDEGTALIFIRRVSYSQANAPVVASRSWTIPKYSLVYELKR